MQARTDLPCQGHTTRSVAEVGLEFGILRLHMGGGGRGGGKRAFPSLTQFPRLLNSKPSGWRLKAFSPCRLLRLGFLPFLSFRGPSLRSSLPPAPHLSARYHAWAGGAGTLGLVEFPTRQEKEQRNCVGERVEGMARRVAKVEATLHHGI